MNQTFITLNDGTKIPQFGLGVYQVPAGEETEKAVREALAMEAFGFRFAQAMVRAPLPHSPRPDRARHGGP